IDTLIYPVRSAKWDRRVDRDLLSIAIGAYAEQSDLGVSGYAGTQRVGARETGVECSLELLFGNAAVAHAALDVGFYARSEPHSSVDIECADQRILSAGGIRCRDGARCEVAGAKSADRDA